MTLRKLMPNAQGKSLDEIKRYHARLITERRKTRLQEMIKNKRDQLSTLKVDQNSTKEAANIIDDEENKSE